MNSTTIEAAPAGQGPLQLVLSLDDSVNELRYLGITL